MKKSRGTLSFVIPEICYRESTSSGMPEIFYQASTFFQYCGPRLKDCRGDEEVGIQKFLSLNNLDS